MAKNPVIIRSVIKKRPDIVRLAGAKRTVRVGGARHGIQSQRRKPRTVKIRRAADGGVRLDTATHAAPKRIVLRSKDEAARDFRSERYRIVAAIGKGGTGTVYKAHDTLLDMPVAMKFLPDSLIHDPDAAERFKNEALFVMRLSHEHIVKVYNVDLQGGRLFLVMEYVDGEDMRRVLQRTRRLSRASVLEITRFCAMAINYAHKRGVLHCDLKPENLMITAESILKIVDFGTASWASMRGVGEDNGYIEGTPCYMSPEQILGRPLDGRVDVYCLALCAYEFLEGQPAFPFDVDFDAVLDMEIADPHHIPEPLFRVIARGAAKDRDARWRDAIEFYAALAEAARTSTEG